MSEKRLGEVTHYFDHLGVGIFKLSTPLKVGDKIHVQGHTTDFVQEVKEMQYEHEAIEQGKKGQEVGVKLDEKVREGDEVFAAE